MSQIIYYLLTVCVAACAVVAQAPAEGTCQCAVFKHEDLKDTCVPLISKTPSFAVPCNVEGTESCMQMCIALAQAAKEQAPEMLCQVAGTLEGGVKPAVFSKACDAEKWTYTGLTAKDAICCSEGKTVPCQADNLA